MEIKTKSRNTINTFGIDFNNYYYSDLIIFLTNYQKHVVKKLHNYFYEPFPNTLPS